jgi:signal transduction histidine kinase
LEQQTATAEVLQVINSSPDDLAPVFDTILEKAHTLCGAAHGSLQLYDGETLHAVATHAVSDKFAEILRQGYRAADSPASRALIEGKRFAHITDCAEIDHPVFRSAAELAGIRTVLFVPLRGDNEFLGLISAARLEVRPFSEKQIALLESFAAQAVIAMENVRLITELRQRTHDLQESLEYQTASGDVLKVISQSGAELEPVLDTLVETAAGICRADSGFIFRVHDGLCRMVASFGIPAQYRDFQVRNPIVPGRGTLAGRTVLERRAVHIEDAAADPEYTRAEAVQLGRQRTMLGVPLVREDALIGVITLARSCVEPFTEKQIALVATFADQAVIAIENARLFNELRERTTELGRSVEELKMLSEVGQAVSSTLDLRAVLSAILTASLGLTWANAGAIFRYSRAERAFRLVEAVGWDEALARSVRDLRVPETESAMGEAVARRLPIQLADLAQPAAYAPLRDVTLAAGFHSALIVPLVGPERILGAIILMRKEAGEFPPETVRLMQTLASQSVLAIQNARLFREIADKSEQLALASQHKSQFLANMSHELRTPLNAILGYAELLVDGIYGQLPDRPKGVLERIQNNGRHLLALINDVLDLAKIEAGQLTLTLEDYTLPEVVRSVATATEPLATSKGLKFTAALQDDMPMAHGDARRVSQVLLNLVGNAIKFTDEGEVEIRAASANGQFTLTVRDTGPGIADADQERIFGEFQQIDNSNTRRKGGTGLGLAISKRMVELQGGTISVESVLGQGSTFRVVLPVHVDEMMEAA